MSVPENLGRYLQDESNLKSTGIEDVLMPEGAADLSFYLKNSKKTFTVFGGGTGITGGAVGESGIIISTEKFSRIKVKAAEGVVETGAGVRLSALHGELAKYGLWYPVDSTEQTATIGGNAATNAWGTRSYKYGSIREFVRSVSFVRPDGEYFEVTRGEVKAKGLEFDSPGFKFGICDASSLAGIKNSAGYYMKPGMDLVDLIIGSEGTLGVITGLTLQVKKAPGSITAFMVPFDDTQKALDFTEKVKKNRRLDAVSLEYMDDRSVDLLKEKFSFPEKCRCAVFIEVEEGKGSIERVMDFTSGCGLDAGAIMAEDTLKKDGFVYGVREALPQMVNEAVRRNGMRKVSTDFSVRDADNPALISAYSGALSGTKLKHVIFGHAGNNNLHINFLPENKAGLEEALEIYDQLAKTAAGLGGTVSAEHGIGKLKKKYIKYMYTEDRIKTMKKIKMHFDPQGISCPGNIFD